MVAEDFFDDATSHGSYRAKRLDRQQKKTDKARKRQGTPLLAKTEKQQEYIDCLRTSNQVFAIGGAGTGKTYVAAAFAIQELINANVEKIVITRPNVSRPEHRIGFLPGDLKAKMEPWLVPVMSAFKQATNPENVKRLMQAEQIEIVPFEFMRGRTFDNSFVILDEAQNCTLSDLKLFLTRVGEDSTVVLSGDVDQVDIHNSGLFQIVDMVRRMNLSADVIEFGPADVVRSAIAKEWVQAFARSGL